MMLGCFSAFKVQAQDVSVEPSSGNAIVTIPLYNLQYGSLSVPITLVHSGSAIGVAEGDGDAGLGWNLSCTYGVFREVRGLPDETSVGSSKLGWHSTATTVQSFTPQSDDDFSSWSSGEEGFDYTTLAGFQGIKDTEPDIYTISAPNLYARFVYDVVSSVKTIRLLEYQDIQITELSGSNGFTVINNLGHVYQFTVEEVVKRKANAYKNATVDMFQTQFDYYKAGSVPPFTSVWYLASVTDERNNAVNFSYSTQPKRVGARFITRIKTATNAPDTLYTIEDDVTPMRLSTITGGNYTVNFDWTRSNRLNIVKVSESGLNDSFEYAFSYQTTKDNVSSGIQDQLHYFLTELKLMSPANCDTESPYRFAYVGVGNGTTGVQTVDFTWRTGYARDFWGYYNGVTLAAPSMSNVVPALNFYNALTDSRRFVFHTISGQTATALSGANRNPKADKLSIGTLLRVTNPSGGYTKIEWERNKYLDSLAGKVLYGPGMRVKSLTTSGGDAAYNRNATTASSYHDIIKTYKYERSDADTTTSGIIFYPPSYGISTGAQLIRTLENQAPESKIAYRRIKESVSGYGSKVYIFSWPARYPFTTYSTDWAATKSKIARGDYILSLSNIQNGYYTFPFAPNPNYSFSQGQLTSVTEYSETGLKTRERKIYYSRINPALASVWGVRYEKFDDCSCYHFSRYQIITGSGSIVTQEVVSTADDQPSPAYSVDTKNYYYNNTTSNYLLNSVESVMGDGAVTRQYIKYVKDFASIASPAPGDVMANALNLMNTARRHGEVVETYTTYTPPGGTLVYIDASLQTFKDFGAGKVYAYRTYSIPKGLSFTPAAVAVQGGNQGFSKDPGYFLTTSIDEYDSKGNPVSLSDDDKNLVAVHYAQDYALPGVARFSKATAKQTLYDGFEFNTGRNLTPTYTLPYTTGWTGERAGTFLTSNTLTNNTVDNNGSPYRVSCYIKATANANLLFKFWNGSNDAGNVTLNYTTANSWAYLEGVLTPLAGAPSQLKLTVNTNTTVTIDDIIVMPIKASVVTQTFLPFKGPTSQTDDRGNSSTATYDIRGRKLNVFDRQRNQVEANEYLSKVSATVFINSAFSAPTITAGSSFTATASSIGNCFANPQYQWKIDGVNVGTSSSSLTTTLTSVGAHTLSLTVTNPATSVSSTTTEDVCVLFNGDPFQLTDNLPEDERCHNGPAAEFTINPITFCGASSPSVRVKWETSVDGVNYQVESPTGTTFSWGGYNPNGPFGTRWVRITVTQSCPGGQNNACSVSTLGSYTMIKTFELIDCSN